jgi:exodeoxyribonuclease VIII
MWTYHERKNMNKNNVMIDIETMGTEANAAIVAVGAVRFNKTGIDETSFYAKLDLEEVCKHGMEMDASTVLWWLKQSDEARAELTDGETTPLHIVMDELKKFLGDDAVVWGNGSDFDNVIVSTLYTSFDREIPWKFWNSQCYRTIKNIYRDIKMERRGTHHNALYDAISQAEHLIAIANAKGFNL